MRGGGKERGRKKEEEEEEEQKQRKKKRSRAKHASKKRREGRRRRRMFLSLMRGCRSLLRKGVDENLDFILLVPSAVADLGTVDYLRFDRTVLSVGIRKTMKQDLYPAFVDFGEVQHVEMK